jgi:uncharacterized membrane protein YdfJ with MMPL/SSD domain
MFDALTRLAQRHHWRVIAAAVIAGAVAGVFGAPVAGLLKGGGFNDPTAQSVLATGAIQQATGVDPDNSIVAIIRPGVPVLSAAGEAEVNRVVATLGREPAVASVMAVTTTHDPRLVAKDGLITYVVAPFRNGSNELAAAKRIQAALGSDRAVTLGGATIAENQVEQQVSRDLGHAEELAFPILFVLLLIVFRGLIAAMLPLMVGGLTILLTFLGLRAVDAYTDLSIFALNLVTGLSLGLAIDYSLLIVSRFREELDRSGGDSAAALRRTLTTAGRTVLFSSITVAAACASLLVFRQRFLYSMGVGGVIGTVVEAAVALVVLPAVLAALGPNIDRFALRKRRPRPDHTGAWYRLALLVMRRPITVAVVTVAALVALGLPFLGIRFTSVDASDLPMTAPARQVDDVLRHSFDVNRLSPAEITVGAPSSASAEVAGFARAVSGVQGVATVTVPRAISPNLWEINAELSGNPLSDSARQAVKQIRTLPSASTVMVGGQTAQFVDLQSSLGSHLPLALAIIAATTLLVLFAATGSVVLPIKALVMNIASISATFGILVLIFQDGRFQSLLGYTSQGALESTQPILLVALAFGLSTDYGVFLLTRIKEHHDRGTPTRESVALGLERTGRIITAAAICFTVAIGAFATSEIIFIKELGIGTGVAVLIDATIVRALLVPALMALLGKWNWWAPRPLRALHRQLRLDRLENVRAA